MHLDTFKYIAEHGVDALLVGSIAVMRLTVPGHAKTEAHFGQGRGVNLGLGSRHQGSSTTLRLVTFPILGTFAAENEPPTG